VKRRIVPVLALTIAVAMAFLAYLNPVNALHWSYLMTLCR